MMERPKTVSAASRTPLVLEPLEERIAPAGNVVAAAIGGNLVITGDALGNSFVIDQVGVGPDQLRVTSGGDGTTVNGDTIPLIFDVTGE